MNALTVAGLGPGDRSSITQAALQAVADTLTLCIAIPIMAKALKEIRRYEAADAAANRAAPTPAQAEG